uniref:LRRCT domain-containing protein n=1 Tax=Branchiostoma floridae TaxID=7739 RepID=C3XTI8_BRAFL|eukprot:XP_002612605.1 hypothetical protein BRAFLDRAFT_78770 [Branchiostoma floridae]
MLWIFVLAAAVVPNCLPIPLAPPCETSCSGCDENILVAMCDDKQLASVPSRFPPKVSMIRLQDNEITQLPRAAFVNMSPKLSQLNLSNNRILYIEDNAFDRLTNLWGLDLSRNNLTSVTDQTLRGLRRLRKLCLQSNMIKFVSDNAFLGIVDINTINFRDNRLTEVPWSAVQRTSARNLQKFDLSRNNIQTAHAFPEIDSKSTMKIWLGENPWCCDCELTPFLKSLKTIGAIPDRDRMTCAGPEALQGEKLDVPGIEGIVSKCCLMKESSGQVCENETSEMFAGLGVAAEATTMSTRVATITTNSADTNISITNRNVSSYNHSLIPSNLTGPLVSEPIVNMAPQDSVTPGRNSDMKWAFKSTSTKVFILLPSHVPDPNPYNDIVAIIETSVYAIMTVQAFVGMVYFAVKLASLMRVKRS